MVLAHLNDGLLPNAVWSRRLLAYPTLQNWPAMEQLDSTRPKALGANEEPKCVADSTAKVEPKRPAPRREQLLFRCTHSITEMQAADSVRVTPVVDTVEPRRAKLLRLEALPGETEPKAEISDSGRRCERRDNVLLSVTRSRMLNAPA